MIEPQQTHLDSADTKDEILPHGTMLELLKQGFSAAYDKVIYDRSRGARSNVDVGLLKGINVTFGLITTGT